MSRIYVVKGEKVMLDRDLAELYGIETRALKQAVKRNIERFLKDFMFEIKSKEIDGMVSQNVIPSKSYFGGANTHLEVTNCDLKMFGSIIVKR